MTFELVRLTVISHAHGHVVGAAKASCTCLQIKTSSASQPASAPAFAVWRETILASTGKRWPLIGLSQTSWSPLPCRTIRQPASRRIRFKSLVKSANDYAAQGQGLDLEPAYFHSGHGL